MGEQGARFKRGVGARTWPENARSWARPRRGDHGQEVEDELIGGDGGTERERAGAGKRNDADRSAPPSSKRERGREGARARQTDRRGPPVSAGGRARKLG